MRRCLTKFHNSPLRASLRTLSNRCGESGRLAIKLVDIRKERPSSSFRSGIQSVRHERCGFWAGIAAPAIDPNASQFKRHFGRAVWLD